MKQIEYNGESVWIISEEQKQLIDKIVNCRKSMRSDYNEKL